MKFCIAVLAIALVFNSAFARNIEGTDIPLEGSYRCVSYETNQESTITIPPPKSGKQARFIAEYNGFSPAVDKLFNVDDVALSVLDKASNGELVFNLYLKDKETGIACRKN